MDMGAYLILAGVAWLVYRSFPLAKMAYAVLAVTWYVSLIFFLPQRFGQLLDIYMLFMQIILMVVAYVILMAPKHN
jgi:hypothetical protein